MSILIKRVGGLFEAKVIESYLESNQWMTEIPVSEHQLKEQLRALNLDQREIEEAFLKADPSYFGVGKW